MSEMRKVTCRVTGSYKGERLEAVTTGYAHLGLEEDGKWSLHRYYWEEGNLACHCNRLGIFRLMQDKYPELYWKKGDTWADGTLVDEDYGPRCGEGEILIDRIEPIDTPDVEPLILDESP